MRKLDRDEIALKRYSRERLAEEPRLPVYLLLENIRSLYNVGSVFRSADGARVARLLLCGFTPRPPRKEIEKTALGATSTVPWEYFGNVAEAVGALRAERIPLCVVEHTDMSKPYYALAKRDFPLCLAIGNEITGISPELLAHADAAIDIPMFGMKQSLNAAVAAGIVLYECVRILKVNGV
jgi:tRNA G18 (ribose-2'-O)-methylase SpoU